MVKYLSKLFYFIIDVKKYAITLTNLLGTET